MTAYLFRRLLQAIPTLIGVTFISFFIMRLAPGDPIALITFNPNINSEQRAQLRSQFCLDRNVFEQYVIWVIGDLRGECNVRGLINGDFGTSIYDRRPVASMIAERLPATLQLSLGAFVLGTMLGLAVGVGSAINRGGIFDNFARFFSVVFDALPVFWLGLMLIMYFSVELGWFPTGGRGPIGRDATLLESLRYLVLPTIVLSVGWVAVMSRFMRAETLEVIRREYVRTAHAKGLHPRRVYFWHAARNALIPIVTIIGPAILALLSGTVIVERIFSWPGLGRLLVDAVSARDYPIVMGGVIIGAFIVILGNLLTDVLLVLVDPRIRLE